MRRKPKAPAGLNPDYKNLYQAFVAVGQDTESQLRWLHDFARRDLSNAVVCEVSRWEVDAFVQNWAVRWNIEPFRSLFATAERAKVVIAEGVAVGPIIPSRIPPFCPPDFGVDVVPALQGEAMRLLNSLLTEHHYTDRGGYSFPEGVFAELSIKGIPRRAHIVTRSDPRSRFIGAMACLLLFSGPLSFCVDCYRMFVPRRPWQRFCSPRCTNRASQATHRKKVKAAGPKPKRRRASHGK
jgi:hypothetical protein